MKNEITNGIYAKEIYQLIRIENISLGLAHLSISLEQPWMAEYLFGQRKSQSHQQNRPVNGMKTDDVLSDQMQVRRPVFFKLLCAVTIAVITDAGDVIGQRIQPYIDHMLWIKIHRDSPFKGGSGYTQILKSREKEI